MTSWASVILHLLEMTGYLSRTYWVQYMVGKYMEWWVVGTVYGASYLNVSISTVSITCRLLREGYNLGRQEVYMFLTNFCFLVVSANNDDACIVTHILLQNQYHIFVLDFW